MQRKLTISTIAMALLAFSLPARGAIPQGCQPVLDAIRKQITTPTHMYVTETLASRPGKPESSEMIYAGGAIYVRSHGTWLRSEMTPGELQKQQADNEVRAKAIVCRVVRAEAVKGEAATVYSERSEMEEATSAVTTWVSKKRGLPLRVEMDVDTGGKAGKSHRSVRFEYANVKAPAGVK